MGGGAELQWRTEGTLPRLRGSGDQNVLLLAACRTVRIFPDVCVFFGGGAFVAKKCRRALVTFAVFVRVNGPRTARWIFMKLDVK
jgi:hypothetical protein